MPFYPFLGEGSPTKIDYRTKILTSQLEDLGPRGFWTSLEVVLPEMAPAFEKSVED